MAKDDPQIIELTKPLGIWYANYARQITIVEGSAPVEHGSYFIESTYIDMSGWTVQDKTVFITGISWNDLPSFQGVPQPVPPGLPPPDGEIGLIATLVPYSSLEQLEEEFSSNRWPGCLGSSMNMDAVVHFRISRYMAAYDNALLARPLDSHVWSGTNAIASNKLYLYRIISAPTVDGQGIGWHTGLFQAQGIATEEPDLEYIYRLKRSYELAADQV